MSDQPRTPFSFGSDVWPGVSKLVEEIGELNQVLGKLITTGGAVEHWDGTNLAIRLVEEIGDVLASAYFVVDENGLNKQAIALRMERKRQQFEEWNAHG